MDRTMKPALMPLADEMLAEIAGGHRRRHGHHRRHCGGHGGWGRKERVEQTINGVTIIVTGNTVGGDLNITVGNTAEL